MRLLQVLRALCQRSPDCVSLVGDTLAQITTNTAADKDKSNNASNAVLYECIYTILAISNDKACFLLTYLKLFIYSFYLNYMHTHFNTLTRKYLLLFLHFLLSLSLSLSIFISFIPSSIHSIFLSFSLSFIFYLSIYLPIFIYIYKYKYI